MQTTESAIESEPIGCIIDGSAESADYINKETIAYAESFGFDTGDMPEDESEDFSQILSEVADDAVEFLNSFDNAGFWTFEENSLFHLSNDDDATI